MYITDWRLDSIVKLHKLNGDMEEIVTREPQNNRLYGVKIYSQKEQIVDPLHPCLPNANYFTNHSCQKLCFGIPSGYSAGLKVNNDHESIRVALST